MAETELLLRDYISPSPSKMWQSGGMSDVECKPTMKNLFNQPLLLLSLLP